MAAHWPATRSPATAGGNSTTSRACAGFTLIELIIVLGIIALLIGMLMPVLASARERGNRIVCISQLRNIGMAAQLHVNEHQGFLPTAGWHWKSVDGVTNPRGIGDESRARYEYYNDDGIMRPLPITAALGEYLGADVATHSREALEADLRDNEFLRKLFRCPSQQVEYHGWTQRGDEGGSWIAPEEYSSYAFNEALLGRRPAHLAGCPKGHLARVAQPSLVMFAMDGRPRDLNGIGNRCFLVPAKDHPDTPQETLHDFQRRVIEAPPSEGGRELLDFVRHRMRVHVLFCDGHVETFHMGLPPEGGEDLKRIHVSLGFGW